MSELSHIVEQIKNRVAIVDVLQPTVRVIRNGNRLVALCPFHKEKSPSFNIDNVKGSYHCFGCGQHGDHFSFLIEKKGMTFGEALKMLADQAGVTLPERTSHSSHLHKAAGNEAEQPATNRWYQIMEEAANWYQAQLQTPRAHDVRSYLDRRDVAPHMQTQFKLGYSPEYDSLKEHLTKQGFTQAELLTVGLVNDKGGDRFRGRLMFPIWDAKGRVIAFGGRALKGDQMPKYLNSSDTPLFHKSTVLYAQNLAFQNVDRDTAPLVVEGYMDTITLHQYGFKTAVAPLGTAFTDDHLKRLWQRHANPVFCFDGDQAGRSAAFRVAQKVFPVLKPHFSVSFCFLPNGEDPDTYLKKNGAADFSNYMKTAQSLINTLWQGYIEKYGITRDATPEEKTRLKKSLFDHIDQMADVDLKQFFKQDVSDKIYNFFKPIFQKNAKATKTDQINKIKDSMQQSLKNIKKNHIPAKILLVTLKNNPILVGKVYEMLLSLDGLPEDLIAFRDFLCEHNFNNQAELIISANLNGHEKTLADLDQINLQALAPFALPGEDETAILNGWTDIWQQHFLRSQMKDETRAMKNSLMLGADEKKWEQWQQIKIVAFPKNEE
jgi:DNA primase